MNISNVVLLDVTQMLTLRNSLSLLIKDIDKIIEKEESEIGKK